MAPPTVASALPQLRVDSQPAMHIVVRYGLIPQVIRCPVDEQAAPSRGTAVLLRSSRGLELGTVLEFVRTAPREPAVSVAGGSRLEKQAASLLPDDSRSDSDFGTADPRENREPADSPPVGTECQFERVATPADLQRARELRAEADAAFAQWQQRFADWRLQLELLDLEWTLDRGRLIVYVLGGRGAETTRLSLLAAACGAGPLDVQPVSADGLVPAGESKSGGCGSGGCGCRT